MKKLIKTVFFLILGLLVLDVTENVLERKYHMGTAEDFERTFSQFYKLEEDKLQAVFLGKSTVKWAVSPVQIYEDSNIVTYNLATNAQSIEVSYYLLNEVFEKQSPKVVFCDISALYGEPLGMTDLAWHNVMDNMPISENKIKAALTYGEISCGGEVKEQFNTHFLSMISPLYCYHSRWDELTKNDFMRQNNVNYDCTAGYHMTTAVIGTGLTFENINSEITVMDKRSGFKTEYINGVCVDSEIDGNLYDVELESKAVEYIKKMKKLCEEHQAELVMIKIPTLGMPQLYYASWSYDKYLMAKEFCDGIGVPLLDMVYDTDTFAEIDWKQDSIDGGMHLNFRGAKKVTKCVTDYLQTLGLEKKSDELYERFTRDYEKISQICDLQTEYNFTKYIDKVLENSDYTILVSAQNDFQASLSEELIHDLERLGFHSCFTNDVRDSFIGVIENGEVVYEVLSNRRSEYQYDLAGGEKISIVSSGLNTGSYSSIQIDGIEYSTNVCGLNIVVFDNEMHLVVDSVNFNTSVYGAIGYRDMTIIAGYLSAYKEAVMNEQE